METTTSLSNKPVFRRLKPGCGRALTRGRESRPQRFDSRRFARVKARHEHRENVANVQIEP